MEVHRSVSYLPSCLLGNADQRNRYNGEDQWSLEGVQPGGIRSGAIYGTWSPCTHEPGGPVGPFVYAPEELCTTNAVTLRGVTDAF